MIKYVCFLRGVNVGGKNRVSMPVLKKLFEFHGFSDVITYINSGNIIFTTNNNDIDYLIEIIETIITKEFLLDIPVTVLSIDQLSEIISFAPLWWLNEDKSIINYLILLIPPTSVEQVYNAVGKINPEYESIDYYNNVIFWSAPRKTYNKARYSKIASSSVNNKVTIRNYNTIKKIIELANR